jgi:hypothetical protein
MAVLREGIELGTTAITWLLVCVPASRNARLHTLQTNHTIGFVYVRTGVHRNTIESMWRHSSIPSTGWRSTSPGPLHVCGGVPIRQRRPPNVLHPYHCKHWLERETSTQLWSCGYVTGRRPIPRFKLIVTYNRWDCGRAQYHGLRGLFVRHTVRVTRHWNYELLYHNLKEFLL